MEPKTARDMRLVPCWQLNSRCGNHHCIVSRLCYDFIVCVYSLCSIYCCRRCRCLCTELNTIPNSISNCNIVFTKECFGAVAGETHKVRKSGKRGQNKKKTINIKLTAPETKNRQTKKMHHKFLFIFAAFIGIWQSERTS